MRERSRGIRSPGAASGARCQRPEEKSYKLRELIANRSRRASRSSLPSFCFTISGSCIQDSAARPAAAAAKPLQLPTTPRTNERSKFDAAAFFHFFILIFFSFIPFSTLLFLVSNIEAEKKGTDVLVLCPLIYETIKSDHSLCGNSPSATSAVRAWMHRHLVPAGRSSAASPTRCQNDPRDAGFLSGERRRETSSSANPILTGNTHVAPVIVPCRMSRRICRRLVRGREIDTSLERLL